jgi:hypothetical protein
MRRHFRTCEWTASLEGLEYSVSDDEDELPSPESAKRYPKRHRGSPLQAIRPPPSPPQSNSQGNSKPLKQRHAELQTDLVASTSERSNVTVLPTEAA